MNWIALNIPLAVVMVGFAAGLPLWVMLKHPETDRPVALDPSVLRAATTAGAATTDPAAVDAPTSPHGRLVFA